MRVETNEILESLLISCCVCIERARAINQSHSPIIKDVSASNNIIEDTPILPT